MNKKLLKGFIIVQSIVCLNVLYPSTVYHAETKDDLSVRPSALKETVDREEPQSGKTLEEIYGSFYENLNTGNYTGGAQNQYTKNEHTNQADFNDPTEVVNNTVTQKNPVPKGKAVKGTQEDIDALIAYAKSKEGNNYLWGHENPDVKYPSSSDGADCSGYMWAIFDHFGYKYVRTTASDMSLNWGVQISEGDMRPGDLVFFAENDNPKGSVCHVGLYIGNNQVIQAEGGPNKGGQIKIAALKNNPKGGLMMYTQAVVRIRRVIAAGGTDSANKQTETPGGAGTIANIDAIKAKGSKSNIVVTKLDGYSKDTAIMYSVGSKYTIGIDAGHQMYHTDDMLDGTTSELSGIPEYKLAMIQANLIRKALNKAGFNVLMARTANDASISNKARGELFSRAKCDAAVAIHYDSAATVVKTKGITMVYATNTSASWYNTSVTMGTLFKEKMRAKNTGIQVERSDQNKPLSIHDKCSIPYFLVELGFISDGSPNNTKDSDAALVETTAYRNAVADAFVETFKTYFKA